MGQIALQLPVLNNPNSTEAPKIISDMTTIQTVINGNLDTSNVSSSAGITRTQLAAGAWFLAIQPVVTANATAVSGQLIRTGGAGSPTITLPTPTANAIVGVTCAMVTGATTTVASAGGAPIYGLGMQGVTTFPLGSFGSAVLQADGTNWFIVSGQQDTGWVALTLSAGVGATGGSTYTPSARLVGDTVRLRGTMTNTSGGNIVAPTSIFTVASTMHPAGIAYISTLQPTAGAAVPIVAQVPTSGIAQAFSGAWAAATQISLDGLSYSLS